MPVFAVASSNLRRLGLVTALALVTTVAIPPAPAHAFINKRNYYRAKHATQALMAGTFKDGSAHTYRAVRDEPIKFGIKLIVVGLAGASAKKFGIDPAPLAIAASVGTLGIQYWKSMPELRGTSGLQRVRNFGANYVWPTLIGVGTTVGGEYMGHSGHAATNAAAHAANTSDVIKAGWQTIVIAGDVPTVLQTAFRDKSHDKPHE